MNEMNQLPLAIATVPMQRFEKLLAGFGKQGDAVAMNDHYLTSLSERACFRRWTCRSARGKEANAMCENVRGDLEALSFAMDEVRLFLDTHPTNTCALKAYQELHTQRDAAERGDEEGGDHPFPAARLLADGQKGGGAGPVHQGEQHGADSRDPGPAVAHQKIS
mgnify:CR=1 FL=1